MAVKPVRSGQELTLNYGERYWLDEEDQHA